MARPFSKRLVIDACVARAAGGEEAQFPLSKNCRDFLQCVFRICHRALMTPDVRAEWRKHQSSFAGSWFVEMERKGKIVHLDPSANDAIRDAVFHIDGISIQIKEAILKDCHLVDAALASDNIIVSRDEIIKNRLVKYLCHMDEIKRIVWVNPGSTDAEQPIAWLKEGAKTDESRRLGSQSRLNRSRRTLS